MHEDGIRLGDVALGGALLAPGERGLLRCLVESRPQIGYLVVEQARLRLVHEAAIRDADADEDADHERQEHGGQRGDVVTEIEHQDSAPVWHRA